MAIKTVVPVKITVVGDGTSNKAVIDLKAYPLSLQLNENSPDHIDVIDIASNTTVPCTFKKSRVEVTFAQAIPANKAVTLNVLMSFNL